MILAKKRVRKVGDEQRPLRLTRLRSILAGAPKIMTGLDARNRTSESLPPDPVHISTREVLHRLPHSHPKHKPKFKIIWGPKSSLSTASAGGTSVSDERPGHEAEPNPAPAEGGLATKAPRRKAIKLKRRAAAKPKPAPAEGDLVAKAPRRKTIKRKRRAAAKPKPKPNPIATKLRRLPQTPPSKVIPPGIEKAPNSSDCLVRFRTEGFLVESKRPGPQAEEGGSEANSEASAVMLGARRLCSREDFERRGKSGQGQYIYESAADDLCSSPSPSPPAISGSGFGQGELCAT